MAAIDFQATGIPVLRCPACKGILAPRDSAAGIHAKFRFLRGHGAMYAVLGETIAGEARRRMEAKYGPAGAGTPGEMAVPFPIVVPLADDAPETGSLPLVTYGLIGVSVFLFLVGQVMGARLPLPGGLPGLPSGTGFIGVPKLPLLFAAFFLAWGSGPIVEFLNPAALSLTGNLAGFGTGVFGAIIWSLWEDAVISVA